MIEHVILGISIILNIILVIPLFFQYLLLRDFYR